jgi:hypothetical protein
VRSPAISRGGVTPPDSTTASTLASPRVAADLAGVPTVKVLDLINRKAVRVTRIRGKAFVDIDQIERVLSFDGGTQP